MGNVGEVARFSGSRKISLSEDRRLKDTWNLQIEDFKIVLIWRLKIWQLSQKIEDLNS